MNAKLGPSMLKSNQCNASDRWQLNVEEKEQLRRELTVFHGAPACPWEYRGRWRGAGRWKPPCWSEKSRRPPPESNPAAQAPSGAQLPDPIRYPENSSVINEITRKQWSSNLDQTPPNRNVLPIRTAEFRGRGGQWDSLVQVVNSGNWGNQERV